VALRRDSLVIVTALASLTTVAALATVSGIGMSMSALEMTRMARAPGLSALGLGDPMPGMVSASWTGAYALAMLAMWWTMMLAMMLPSAVPMILQFTAIERLKENHGQALSPYIFASGYIVAWGGFSLAAVALQWLLSEGHLLSPMLLTDSRWLAALLLVGAGVWQLSPLKARCLTVCQTPVPFLVRYWRQGPLRMGLLHGGYCIGCCWALMLLLFYGGVMNLYWVLGLAILVLVEKLLPVGDKIALLMGGALVIWGLALAAHLF
jgi:predicted metal-binding membrane protein